MSGKFRGKILCDANDIMIPKEVVAQRLLEETTEEYLS